MESRIAVLYATKPLPAVPDEEAVEQFVVET